MTVREVHNNEYEIFPKVVVTAPGRFHLIGEHSWFFKDKTLSMAVDIPVYAAVSRRSDSNLHFFFEQMDERKRGTLTSLKYKKEDKWASAIKSVIFGFTSGGYKLSGMDITVSSDLLPSAGFGITTAIKCAVALAIRTIYDLKCDESQLLQVIERADRLFLQQEFYRANYYATLYAQKGNLLLTDHTKNQYTLMPIPFKNKQVLLVDASVPRISMWDEFTLFEPENALLLGDLREEKNSVFGGWQYIGDVTDVNEELSVVSQDTRRKLLCIMREHFDILECIVAMEKNDFSRFARAVNHSHESLRDYYDLSCPEIDWLLKRVSEIEPNLEIIHNPVSCGRLSGKGFGRCIYTILRNSDVEKFKQKLMEYEKTFGFKTACYNVTSADGAHIIEKDT